QGQERGDRLVAIDLRLRELAFERPLLELDLVEVRGRDLTGAHARLAHPHRLAILGQVLAREPQPLAGDHEPDETGTHLEGERPLEVATQGHGLGLLPFRRRYARRPLAPQHELLGDARLRRDRLADPQAGRIRLSEGQVAPAERRGGVGQQARRGHVARRRPDAERARQQLRVLLPEEAERLVERQADAILPPERGSGEDESQHEPDSPHGTTTGAPAGTAHRIFTYFAMWEHATTHLL